MTQLVAVANLLSIAVVGPLSLWAQGVALRDLRDAGSPDRQAPDSQIGVEDTR